MTVRDLIKGSLRLIGAIATGETPSADESADALGALKRMLSSWSTEGLTIFSYEREVFPLIAGQSRYSMGPAGDFDSTRPVSILSASAAELITTVNILVPYDPGDPIGPPVVPPTPEVTETIFSCTTEFPVRIIGVQEWSLIQDKTIQSNYAQLIYSEGTNPLENINVWPVPSSTTALVLYTKKALTEFTSLNDTITFPPGYEEAILYNLAFRLAPEYGKPISQEVSMIAMESKGNIKRQNSNGVLMKSDAYFPRNNGTLRILTGR